MKSSRKLFFLLSTIILGIACAIAAGMAEQIIPELSGVTPFLLVGTIFGLMNFLLIIVLYPREDGTQGMEEGISGGKKDEVTGLLNRKAFDLDSTSLKSPLHSYIIMDVDNYKVFKDSHGDQAAQSMMQRIGKTIKANIRSNDLAYSYQGDVFAVLLFNCDKDQAIKIAEKTRDQISRIDNSPYPQVTVSVAVVTYPEDGANTKDLLTMAEDLLKSAKKSGKNATFAMARGKIS